jgi:4-oxalocrotonate tautomerase
MPITQIQILEGRTPEQKKMLIRAVTEAIAAALQAKPESIRVIIQEVPKEHWGIGGSSARELGR